MLLFTKYKCTWFRVISRAGLFACHATANIALHSAFTQMSELNLNDYDVFQQACIDEFYCNKPRNFILHEKNPAYV